MILRLSGCSQLCFIHRCDIGMRQFIRAGIELMLTCIVVPHMILTVADISH